MKFCATETYIENNLNQYLKNLKKPSMKYNPRVKDVQKAQGNEQCPSQGRNDYQWRVDPPGRRGTTPPGILPT